MQEQEGFDLFDRKAGCSTCHAGFAFADDGFYDIFPQGSDAAADRHRFRTPTLRELAYTAPYLHDGSAATLGEAIAAHDGPVLAEAERAALIAFLATLSSDGSPIAAPPLDAEGAISWQFVPQTALPDRPPSGGLRATP